MSKPQAVSELGGRNDDTPPTFNAATLRCDPLFTDWSDAGTIHVYDAAIVPGGTYAIQAVTPQCDLSDEAVFSAPLMLTTGRFGDLAGRFEAGEWTGADGSVDVTFDVLAVLDAFASRPQGPFKPRADLEPATPDQLINITDVTKVVDAFRGADYPFAPGPAPCGE